MKRKVDVGRELARLKRSMRACSGFGAMSFMAAAQAMGVPLKQVRSWVDHGTVLAISVRGEKMVPRSELRRLLLPH